MRLSRAALLVPVATVAGMLAGPLTGVAAAAPTETGHTPSTAYVTSSVSLVTVTFNQQVNSPSLPIQNSSISITNTGTNTAAPCSQQITSDNLTLRCAAVPTLTDGSYRVDYTAVAALPNTGTTTGQFSFTIDTTAPVPTAEVPADTNVRVQSPAHVTASYAELLDHAASSIVVKNSQNHTVAGSSAVADAAGHSTITWTPTADLTEGVYTATASAKDLAGNTNTKNWQFTVDNTPPSAPTNLASNAYVNSADVASYVVSGNADDSVPGSAATVVVTATDGTSTVTFPTANVSSGAWTTAPTDLSSLQDSASNDDQPISFSAVALDSAGNQSPAATITRPKDTVASAAPTVHLANGVTTTINHANTTLGISGTGAAGDGITVTAWNTSTPATKVSNTTSVIDDGSYVTTLDTSSLADGAISLEVKDIEPAGNVAVTPLSLTKDTAAPTPAPSITTFGPVNIANHGSPATVSGTVPSDTASVLVWVSDADGHATDSQTVAPSGTNFSTGIDTASLDEGVLTAHAVAVDAAGNPSDEGQKLSVKDLQAPGDPTFEPTPPAWANALDYTEYPVSGTADPGTDVVVTAADGSHLVTKDLTVDGTGAWSTTLDLTPLTEGVPITLTVTSTDEAGNPAAQAATAGVTKDLTAPATPSAPTTTDADHGTTVHVSGTGTAGDVMTIAIVSDGGTGTVTDSATVADDGTWSKDVDVTSLLDGTLSATTTEADPAGNVSGASPAGSAVKDTTTLALGPDGTVPSDGQHLQTAGVSTVSATYNEQLDGATSTVTFKDETGNALLTSAPTLSNGKQTISVTPADLPLSDGTYTAVFDVTDLSGVEHVETTISFVVDDVAPSKPTISSLGAANHDDQLVVPVSGTAAEPGGTVTVTVTDGTHNALASTPVGNDSTWSTTVDVSGLTDGQMTATAKQTDAADNVSEASDAVHADKDTVVGTPTAGFGGPVTAAQQTATLSGTGTSGESVTVDIGDANGGTLVVLQPTPVGDDGHWTTSPIDVSSLGDGTLTANAVEHDAAGNASSPQTATTTKDTVAPSIAVSSLPHPFTLGAFVAGWSGSDAGAGVTSYDVRYARAVHGRGLGPWTYPSDWQGITTTSVSKTEAPGVTGCFEIRARDGVGNLSGWSPRTCTTRPMDDRSLSASSGWKRVRSQHAFQATLTTTTTKGATLTLPSSRLDRVSLVAEHCASCGKVGVYVGGSLVKTVDLHSAVTRWRTLTLVLPFSTRTAPVMLTVLTAGKTVAVDGLGTSRL